MTKVPDPTDYDRQQADSCSSSEQATDGPWHHRFLRFQLQHEITVSEFARIRDEHAISHIELLNKLSESLQIIDVQRTEIQALKDEIARIKGTSLRPKLPPGNLEGGGGGGGGGKGGGGNPGRGKHPRKNKTGLTFHSTQRLKPSNLPEGAVFKGCRKYDVQDLICQAFNTRYLIERWKLPDGSYVEGDLPAHIQGHYGAGLRAQILVLTHANRVTEELLLEWLHMAKIAISAGQLSEMLTNGHDDFHLEKGLILDAGFASGMIQTDEVGTRHRSKNCYTNVICNQFFVFMTTSDSKSRINFLKILAQGRNEYRFNQDAYDYLTVHKGADWLIESLKRLKNPVINTMDPGKAFAEMLGHVSPAEIRLLTEAGLVASLIEHGVPRDLNLHSDDAAQFEIFYQSLCWIHEERHYRKLIPAHPEMAAAIEKVRDAIWQLYKDLKAYKEAPSELERVRLSQAFDHLFNPEQPNPYTVLNHRLALTYAKKDRLLRVLDRPQTPLHNNASETAGRGAKVKCKISGGTRSDEGRQAWDTFGSLNLTCRRLGICFYDYLMDRLLGLKAIDPLGDIIRARAKAAGMAASMQGAAMEPVLNTS